MSCRSSSIIILLLEYVLFIGPARAHRVLYAVGGLICCLILNCCKCAVGVSHLRQTIISSVVSPRQETRLLCTESGLSDEFTSGSFYGESIFKKTG